MRRLTSTAIVLAALLLATVAAAPGVSAQDTARHPFIGTWLADRLPEVETNPPEVTVVGPGGTFISADPEGASYGSWVPTGERSADVTFLVPFTDPEAGFVGYATVRASVEVAEDGQSFAGTYTFEPPAAFAEAMGIPAGQLGPGNVTAQRIAVEPMGEPIGPLPDFAEAPAVESAEPVQSTAPVESTVPIQSTTPVQSPAPVESPSAPEASPMAPQESPAA